MFLCSAQDQGSAVLWTSMSETPLQQSQVSLSSHPATEGRERASKGIRGDVYAFVSHLTPTQQLTVARLVGLKCKLLCMLSGGDC